MSQGYTSGIPIDTDGTLSANSNGLIPSQKAVKTYVDTEIAAIPTPTTPDLDAVLTAGNDGGGLEITNIADGSAPTSAATVGQLNDQKRIYALDVTGAASTHTGTAVQTITYSFEIPANTIGLSDCLEIKTWHRKTTGASGSHTITVYLNTSNAIGGDALLNQVQGAATTMMMEAFLKWNNSTTSYTAKNAGTTPWGSNVGGVPFSYTKDTTASLWVIVTVQLATTTDIVTQYMVEVMHHKNS